MKYDIKWFHGLIAVSENVKTPLVGYEQSVAHKLKVITHKWRPCVKAVNLLRSD